MHLHSLVGGLAFQVLCTLALCSATDAVVLKHAHNQRHHDNSFLTQMIVTSKGAASGHNGCLRLS
jgi:hypothetical protein